NNTIITEKPRKIKYKVKKRQPLGCLKLYRKNNIDNTNMNKTPATIGTAVRLTILKGVCLVVPATITMTAETGETALNKLPASPIGTVTAYALIPAAMASGAIRGTIA